MKQSCHDAGLQGQLRHPVCNYFQAGSGPDTAPGREFTRRPAKELRALQVAISAPPSGRSWNCASLLRRLK